MHTLKLLLFCWSERNHMMVKGKETGTGRETETIKWAEMGESSQESRRGRRREQATPPPYQVGSVDPLAHLPLSKPHCRKATTGATLLPSMPSLQRNPWD